MDSSNSYGQRSNFMDLLNSQEGSEYPENLSFERFSQTRPGSSGIPLFSNEDSDAPAVDQEVSKERKRWSKAEDIVLISAWLNTSKDSVVANEQKNSTFWKRIAALYNASSTIQADGKREFNHCKQRWKRINDQVSKFCGSYAAANSPPKSGWKDKDYLRLAHEIFLSDYNVKFMLEHAWNELKYEQKWCDIYSKKGVEEGSSKRRKCSADSVQDDSSQSVNNGEDVAATSVEVRPPGVKAAKAKQKRSGTTTDIDLAHTKKLEAIQTVWDIKQKDAALKAEQSEKNMLESLLARTVAEPLSDLEIDLKNKLIASFLSKT